MISSYSALRTGFRMFQLALLLLFALPSHANAQQQYVIPTIVAADVFDKRLPVGFDTNAGIKFTVTSWGSVPASAIVSLSTSNEDSLSTVGGGSLWFGVRNTRFQSPRTIEIRSLNINDARNRFTITYRRSGVIEVNGAATGQHTLDFSKLDIQVVANYAMPSFTKSPASLQVSVGQEFALSWDAVGDGTISFAIIQNGVIKDIPYLRDSEGKLVQSETGPYLVAKNYKAVATSEDGGEYKILAFPNLLALNDAQRFGTYSPSFTITVPQTAPIISSQPRSSVVVSGSAASFSVVVLGTTPISYQWFKDGAVILGATSSSLTIPSAADTSKGSYTVRATNSVGSVLSTAATLTLQAPRLSNLSVRTTLGANQLLIVGMTMTGGSKNVLLRAVGPTLGVFGVPAVMSDPKLDLYNGSSRIASNDNWQGASALVTSFQNVGAFAYSTPASLDAALLTAIDGGRTVQVSGPSAGTVLVEGYDAGTGDSPRFSNLSARNRVGTGSDILIAGFTLSGNGTRNLLIRAVGPKLSDFGVSGVLQDPRLQIFSGATRIAENDNWSANLASTFSAVGAFALTTGSKDAAIVIPLQAGSYTVQVSGADGGTGEAIVEIYELP